MKFYIFLVIFHLPVLCLSNELEFYKTDDLALETSNERYVIRANRSLFDSISQLLKSKPISGRSSMLKPCTWNLCSQHKKPSGKSSKKISAKVQQQQRKEQRKKLREKLLKKNLIDKYFARAYLKTKFDFFQGF